MSAAPLDDLRLAAACIRRLIELHDADEATVLRLVALIEFHADEIAAAGATAADPAVIRMPLLTLADIVVTDRRSRLSVVVGGRP